MSGDREYDPERLGELIVYVAQRSLADRHFGSTKLNKILFFSDFESYRRTGRSITGAVYQHLPQGPCPQQILPVIERLGPDVRWVEEETYAGIQRRLLALRSSRIDLFSGPEVAVVEEVLRELGPLTNRQTSERSHETVSWRITGDQDEIPYGLALVSQAAPTEFDLDWLEEVGGGGAVEASPR